MPEMVIASAAGHVLLRVNLEGRDKLTLGRSGRCDVRLRGTRVARHHALLFVEHDRWVVTGLSRAAQVWLGDRRVRMAQVNEDDPIRLGDVFIWFYDLAVATPPPMPDLAEATSFRAGTRAEFLESAWRTTTRSTDSASTLAEASRGAA